MTADPLKLALEIDYKHLAYWNVLTLKANDENTEYIALKGVAIELSSDAL